jgi:hypothetical protein
MPCSTEFFVSDSLQSKSRSQYIAIVYSYNGIVGVEYTSWLQYNTLAEEAPTFHWTTTFILKSLRVPASMLSNDDPLEGGGTWGVEPLAPNNRNTRV